MQKTFDLGIPASYEAKTGNISIFWTFWPVYQLINHLLEVNEKNVLPNGS